MLGRQVQARSCIFVEADRVEGPEAGRRGPGLTPGPVIQFGSFNINALENEAEMSAWYARSRLPLVKPQAGSVGARKLVSIAVIFMTGIIARRARRRNAGREGL